ncbi:MAG: SpoIIE family protein phosphatase [Planctomycetes bacterium]|nr:SpoIIE family protein phosphatase [Planctomycetota bacterium]
MSLVLIVDDDKALRAQLSDVLAKAGHSVQEASSGRETLLQAQDHEPDLILLDIRLPDMEALTLLEELRSDQNLVRTPIMMMAEGADQDLLMKTFRWDIVDFIHKPFSMELLVAKIGAHTRLNLAYKFSRKLSKEMYMSRIERLERQVTASEDEITEAERHFTWMQPKPPRIEGYRIEVSYRPYGRLGGDFYDFVWLDRDNLAVVIGDVSGHGVQAAILQTMARKLISLALRTEQGHLHKAVAFANRELTNDLPPGSFVAASFGVLNTATHSWSHVRCGVPYPMWIKGKHSEPVVTAGGPLGLSKKADWHNQVGDYSRVMEPGEQLLLMSDGIIEAYVDDEKKRQFDVEGVVKAIEETPADGSIVSTIYQAADLDHRADDDATMICISRLPR